MNGSDDILLTEPLFRMLLFQLELLISKVLLYAALSFLLFVLCIFMTELHKLGLLFLELGTSLLAKLGLGILLLELGLSTQLCQTSDVLAQSISWELGTAKSYD